MIDYLVKNILLEGNVENFDLNEFKSINSFAGKKKYAQTHLERIGAGTSRIVYEFGEGEVLKMAKNSKGIAQNLAEIEMFNDGIYDHIFADIYDYDEDGSYLISQRADRLKKSEFKRITGISFEDFADELQNQALASGQLRYISKIEIPKEVEEEIWGNDFTRDVLSLIGDYDFPYGDLTETSSYGKIGDEIVLIDYGATKDVINTFYEK
jgi:hypothetical protein